MPDSPSPPAFIFDVEYGARQTPWDLSILLFKAGAAAYVKAAPGLIAKGALGEIIDSRIDMVAKIHEVMCGQLAAGGSRLTTQNQINSLRSFFGWLDAHDLAGSLMDLEEMFIHWSDALFERHTVNRNLSMRSAYTIAARIAQIIDIIFERPSPIISATRLRAPDLRRSATSRTSEKELLDSTFVFGSALQDICDGLSIDVLLKGTLPVRIGLRSGQIIEQWSDAWRSSVHRSEPPKTEKFQAYQSEGSLLTRGPLANLRIEAELLMFIAQTGMNFTQAHQLKLQHFFYTSYLDSYQVRSRKNRRGGEVLFEIFRDYKPHFERYLKWRSELFQGSDLVFPFIRSGRIDSQHPQFRLRSICKGIGINFVSPQRLRNVRINWLLRRSGDPVLTASMAQHTKETLLSVYEIPSQQRAMGEIIRFWSKHDPQLVASAATGPGECDGLPVNGRDRLPNAPVADCIRPSGCLWCEKHMDVDTEDYVWSMASFRHVKLIELSRWAAPNSTREAHPAQLAIDRISEKLSWFSTSNGLRQAWVAEAVARIAEGDLHPDWQDLVKILDGEQ